MVGTEYARRVGVALKAVSDFFEVSQKELAAMSGYNASAISKYEAGQGDRVSAEPLVNIATALGIPLEIILRPAETRRGVWLELDAWRESLDGAAPPAPEGTPSSPLASGPAGLLEGARRAQERLARQAPVPPPPSPARRPRGGQAGPG